MKRGTVIALFALLAQRAGTRKPSQPDTCNDCQCSGTVRSRIDAWRESAGIAAAFDATDAKLPGRATRAVGALDAARESAEAMSDAETMSDAGGALVQEVEKKAELPLCGIYEHNDGTWFPDPQRANRALPCCAGNDSDDKEYCGKSREFWLEYSTRMAYAGRVDSFVHTRYDTGCVCKTFGFEDGYSWIPRQCRLVEWDAHNFCSKLGARTILMIGDSTMEQAASVLMNEIHFAFWNVPTTGCQTQIIFAKSNTLLRPCVPGEGKDVCIELRWDVRQWMENGEVGEIDRGSDWREWRRLEGVKKFHNLPCACWVTWL